MQNQEKEIILAIQKHFEQLAKSGKLVKGLKINPAYMSYYLNISWFEDVDFVWLTKAPVTTIQNDLYLDITIEKITHIKRYRNNLREIIGGEKIEYDWTDPKLLEKLEALMS